MKKNKKTIKIAIWVGVLIVLGLIANNIFIVQPKATRDYKLSSLKSSYQLCTFDASTMYTSNWNGDCEARGKEKNCMLPSFAADGWQEIKDNTDKQCFDTYKLEVSLVK